MRCDRARLHQFGPGSAAFQLDSADVLLAIDVHGRANSTCSTKVSDHKPDANSG